MQNKLEQLADEVIVTDFLIIGGGVSGCMAAIRAKLNVNLDVTIMERGVIKNSGEVNGFDDYVFLIPPGPNKGRDQFGSSLKNQKLVEIERKLYTKPLRVLEEIGIQIKEDDGTYKMFPHRSIKPGTAPKTRPTPDAEGKVLGDLLFYRGSDFKEKLALAVQKSGTRVFNRTLMTSLITKDGTVVGATGINTRTGQFLVFKAKTVLLCAGGAWRLYSYPYNAFPQGLFHHTNNPLNHGGGIAAAFRAGAKLVNLEFLTATASPAGCGRSGGISANFYLRTKTLSGEILEEKYIGRKEHSLSLAFSPNMEASEINRNVLFADSDGATEDDIMATYFSAATEWPRALKILKLRGGVKGPPVETRVIIRGLSSGAAGVMPVNERAETSIKNLFTAGDGSGGSGGGCSNALVWGYLIGDHMRELVPQVSRSDFGTEQMQQIDAEKKRALAPLSWTGDLAPLELEDYVRKINTNYVGIRKIEPRLKRAADLMRMLKERYIPAVSASDYHVLTHALEIQDIIQLSELHAESSLRRTESRLIPSHYRVDYPAQDDEHWKGMAVSVEKIAGEAKYTIGKI